MKIYSAESSSRLRYVLDFVFKQALDTPYVLISEPRFQKDSKLDIYYGNDGSSSATINIKNDGLLFSTGIENTQIDELLQRVLHFLNEDAEVDQCPDILGVIFFFITRYEEYLPHTKDQYGRFSSKESVAFRFKLVRVPIVDQLIFKLATILHLDIPEHSGVQITMDIDQVWLHKSVPYRLQFLRNAKRFLTGQWKELTEGRQVRHERSVDPYDLENILNKYKIHKLLIFILLADRSALDKGHSPTNNSFISAIKGYKQIADVGIHPSSKTKDLYQLSIEKSCLEDILQEEVSKSRYHYLLLDLPSSYTRLLDIGIKHDYSMGFADEIGYRAGTARPFLWYDLTKETTTNLMVHPFCIMDVTLKNYLALSPKDATTTCIKLIEEAKALHIPMRVIWHNSSFYENNGWKPWIPTFETLLQYQ